VLLGTEIDDALDEFRLASGAAVSVGRRTRFDIQYAHERFLRRQAKEKQAYDRLLRRRPRYASVSWDRHTAELIDRRRRRQSHAGTELLLWQEEGWEPWWSLLKIATRNDFICGLDYDELEDEKDAARYGLLKSSMVDLGSQRGFSASMSIAVAGSIFVRGVPTEDKIAAREEHIRRHGSLW
jgi:hypothetical protein